MKHKVESRLPGEISTTPHFPKERAPHLKWFFLSCWCIEWSPLVREVLPNERLRGCCSHGLLWTVPLEARQCAAALNLIMPGWTRGGWLGHEGSIENYETLSDKSNQKCVRLYTKELKYIVERNRRNGKMDYVPGSENSILLKYFPTNWSIDSVQSQSKLQ